MAAAGAGEKFCLRWNDFENNISNSFRELRDDKDFFDVTLACDDNQLKAHKVILSACSPFFRSVLKKNPHPHPLLYLKGVKYEDILLVLNFMYHGEVSVAQEDLNTFLAVAEDLKVKGLTQNNDKTSKQKRQEPPTTTIKRPQGQMPPPQPVPNTKHSKLPKAKTSTEMARAYQEYTTHIKTETPVILDSDEHEEPENAHDLVATGDYPDNYEYEESYHDQNISYQVGEMEDMGQVENNDQGEVSCRTLDL